MRLEKIELSGFKSYDEHLHELELGDIMVIAKCSHFAEWVGKWEGKIL